MTGETLSLGSLARMACWSGLVGVITLKPAAMARLSLFRALLAQPAASATRTMAATHWKALLRFFMMSIPGWRDDDRRRGEGDFEGLSCRCLEVGSDQAIRLVDEAEITGPGGRD